MRLPKLHFIVLLSGFFLPSTILAGTDSDELNYSAIITFVLFIIVTLLITTWAATRTRSRKDFYAAGSSLGGFQNGVAIAGDYMSAASLLGMVGLLFLVGYDTLYFLVSLVMSWAVVLLLIAERLRNLGSYTFADVMTHRFNPGPMRILASSGTLAVAIPYLLAQMVAAGTLVEALFPLNYTQGVITVGILMTIYVSFGGMIATTWIQIIKAILLLGGGTILALGVLAHFNFSIFELAQAAVDKHPEGTGIMQPGGLYPDIISVLSLSLAFIGGTAGLPHVLMRFFTVPDGKQARRSAVVALSLISYFQIIVIFIGLGAVYFLVDHPVFTQGGLSLSGGNNMAAIHLSQVIGGDIFLGFISAVAFSTILAVVSGLTLSAAATVSHDLFANVLYKGNCDDKKELQISRITVVLLGMAAIALAILFEGENVGVLATLPLSIAASTNFPVLVLTMYWRGLTTKGALTGGYVGLALSVVLIILSPVVWVKALGFEEAIFPYSYPTLFSMGAAFFCAWFFSVTDKSEVAVQEKQLFEKQLLKSQLG